MLPAFIYLFRFLYLPPLCHTVWWSTLGLSFFLASPPVCTAFPHSFTEDSLVCVHPLFPLINRNSVFILNGDRPQLAAGWGLIVPSSASSLRPMLSPAQTPLHHHFHIIQWVQTTRPRLINGHSHNPLSFLLRAGPGFKRRSSLNGPGAALSVSFVLLMWDEWGSGGDSPEIAIMHSRSRCVALLAGGGAAGGRRVCVCMCVCKLLWVPFHLRASPPYPSLPEVRVIKHLTGHICLLIRGLVFGRLLSFTTLRHPPLSAPLGDWARYVNVFILCRVWDTSPVLIKEFKRVRSGKSTPFVSGMFHKMHLNGKSNVWGHNWENI